MPKNRVRKMLLKATNEADWKEGDACQWLIMGDVDMYHRMMFLSKGHADVAEMLFTEYYISGLGEYDEENYNDYSSTYDY